MISNSREAKQEGETSDKGPSSSSSGFRNPRIVRVSPSFGGKDRHSKVCTVRGLRDRRIRLSVPTAIQLYDLQERLGVGQPSKVVDWLLEATKDDIHKLPPLQMPLGFNHFQSNPNPPIFDHQNHGEDHQTLFPLTNQSQFPGLLNNGMPLNSYYHWEPPQTENFFNGSVPSPSTVQSSATMTSFFPTYPPYSTNPDGSDSRQMNYLQLLSSNFLSNSAAMRPFSHTQNDDENHGDDGDNTDP